MVASAFRPFRVRWASWSLASSKNMEQSLEGNFHLTTDHWHFSATQCHVDFTKLACLHQLSAGSLAAWADTVGFEISLKTKPSALPLISNSARIKFCLGHFQHNFNPRSNAGPCEPQSLAVCVNLPVLAPNLWIVIDFFTWNYLGRA